MKPWALLFASLLFSFTDSMALGQVSWGKSFLSKDANWYHSVEAKVVADTVLKYQSPQGGWPKNTDLTTPPRHPKDIPQPDGSLANTIDNGATTLPMQFLARVVKATGEEKYELSFCRGIDYLLAAQYPNGGWPQFWPLRKGYYSRITYNDNAMIRTMEVLRDVSEAGSPYEFVDAGRRAKAAAAVARGIDCILKTQIIQDGKRTAWCAQHDQTTLEPAWARAYEPPSLSGGESVDIAKFLLTIEDPSDEIVAAIEGVVEWLRSVQMAGVRVDRIKNQSGNTDRGLVADQNAPPLWARFYELKTNRPLYLDRDSVFRYDYSKISYERRNGYSYHGRWASSLLEKDYPRWRKNLGL